MMMNKIILIALALTIFSCEEKQKSEASQLSIPYCPPPPLRIIYKVVKDLKEVQETHTEYHYKYNVFKGSFYQQPDIKSTSKYFVIYTDGTHDNVSRDKWLGYSKGDSVKLEVSY